MLSASAVCLRKNEVVFCRLPDNLSMASFVSAEDIDAKFDARCSASKWRRMLNGHSLQAYEAMGLSKALNEEVFLLPRCIEGSMFDVNFPLLNRRGRIHYD